MLGHKKMIQDILPHEYSNAWRKIEPTPFDYVLGFKEDIILLKDENTFYQFQDLDIKEYTYLFQIDDKSYFLANLDNYPSVELNVMSLRHSDNREFRFAAATAYHIYDWLRHNKFCGQCGEPMEFKGNERAMVCPNCGNVVYPRINPAIIVGIINDENKLLITKNTHRPNVKMALVAGYTEIGETIEETVIREIKEETGLKVKDIEYYASQPWPFSDSLLFGFWCHVDGDDTVSLDDHELSEAIWTSAEDIPYQENPVSLTMTMIQLFKKKYSK